MELHPVEERVVLDRAGVCSATTKGLKVGLSGPSEILIDLDHHGPAEVEAADLDLWSRPEPVGDGDGSVRDSIAKLGTELHARNYVAGCRGCAGAMGRISYAGSFKRNEATMDASEVPRAVAAAMSIASALDLTVNDSVVLHDSNKLAVRLLPCDVLARVAHVGQEVAQFEVDLAQRLAETESPVAALEPRVEPLVYEFDGFAVTLWTYYEPVSSREVRPADYASALERLHAGMRKLDVTTPHFTDRVAEAQQLVASRDHTPALADADRELLSNTLRSLSRAIGDRGAAEQLLHGEPHPGNMLSTKNGLLFIDLETCCRGPVEFDLAHAPEEVSEQYPGANQDLLRECRILMLAMIATWRWDRDDRFPNGRQLGTEWLSQIRATLDRYGLDAHH